MKIRICFTSLILLTILSACQTNREISRNGCVVGSTPQDLAFDPFYGKYCDADGIPIISSTAVDDLALKQAYYIVMNMLAPIPDIHAEMVSNGAYFAVIGKNEQLTSLPEYAHMDSTYWDLRARGLGGGIENKITSTAEENLLCLPDDRWEGESIAVHEFAHTISLMGIEEEILSQLLAELNSLYLDVMKKGLWGNTYASSNIEEYWAEGVQDYFNTNIESIPSDGVHNYVDTRTDLKQYDPGLFEFIDTFFKGHEWTPTCPDIK